MALRDGSMRSSTPTGWVPRRSVRITYATHQPLRHQRRVRISRRDHAPAPIRACRGEHCSSAERSPKYGTRRCKFVPGWVCEFASACCIFFVFTADGQWPPLHTDTHPSGGRCSYGCTYVRNFLETPIRFYPTSFHNLTVIRHLMHNPKQYVKTQIFSAAGNPKGVRPFWSF